MISKNKLLEKYLNLLLVFLSPTQLALHFWPDFAFVFGIRIDYLSPTVYLTEIIFALLFIPWAIRSRSKILDTFRNNWNLIALFILLVIINTVFSSSPVVSFIKWLKIAELLFVGYYISQKREIFSVKNVGTTLFYSLIFFSLIGMLQFFRGETLGKIFYILGERSFSVFTPGIALMNFMGRNFLRIYSTFPHPNSFAGYIGAALIFVACNKVRFNKVVWIAGISLILLTLLLTFSLSSLIGLFSTFFFYLIFKTKSIDKKVFIFSVIFAFMVSIYFSIVSSPLLTSQINFSQSSRQRLELGNISGKIFADNSVTGTGINTFIINEVKYGATDRSVWLLQPVHNIYLLLFTETGLFGILLLYLMFSKLLLGNNGRGDKCAVFAIIFVLITGLFDHYWITIQQNQFLLALLFGVSFRNKS